MKSKIKMSTVSGVLLYGVCLVLILTFIIGNIL